MAVENIQDKKSPLYIKKVALRKSVTPCYNKTIKKI